MLLISQPVILKCLHNLIMECTASKGIDWLEINYIYAFMQSFWIKMIDKQECALTKVSFLNCCYWNGLFSIVEVGKLLADEVGCWLLAIKV